MIRTAYCLDANNFRSLKIIEMRCLQYRVIEPFDVEAEQIRPAASAMDGDDLIQGEYRNLTDLPDTEFGMCGHKGFSRCTIKGVSPRGMIDHVKFKGALSNTAADIDDPVFRAQVLKSLNQIWICFHANATRATRIKQRSIGTIDRMMCPDIKKTWLLDATQSEDIRQY